MQKRLSGSSSWTGDAVDLNPKRRVRSDICARAGGHCEYCGINVGMRGTLDHYLPKAMGGNNGYDNLRWACLSCNGLKGSMSPTEWALLGPAYRSRPETRQEARIRILVELAQRGRALAQLGKPEPS